MAGDSASMPRGQGDQGALLRSASFEDSDTRMASLLRGRGIVVPSSETNSLTEQLRKKLQGLEPFSDERQKLLQYLQKMERYKQEHQPELQWELQNRLREYDPKQGGYYYTRFRHIDLRKFDLDEECKYCISVHMIDLVPIFLFLFILETLKKPMPVDWLLSIILIHSSYYILCVFIFFGTRLILCHVNVSWIIFLAK
jgi:hypothetical protein